MDNVGVIGNKCVGCEQCAATCPTGAIEMLPNKEGFFYPSVSAEKCIFCGKCLDRCAANVSESQQIYPMETYAGVHNDVQIRTDSSSGGIFSALAKLFLEEYKGRVVGAAYNEKYEVEHIVIHSADELYKLRGSKYVQSRINENIYRDIRKFLDNDEYVLFSGTQCQSVALKKYLNKEYPKLLIVDVLCHGVPSPLALKTNLVEGGKAQPILYLNMRDKGQPADWFGFKYKYKYKYKYKGKLISKEKWFNDSSYGRAFVHNVMLRESCYTCKYKRSSGNVASDLTLGDFWGGAPYDIEPKNYGLSFIMVNTAFGQTVLNAIKEFISIRTVAYDEVVKGNRVLQEAVKRPFQRDDFYTLMNAKGFTYACNKCTGNSWIKRIAKKVLRK